MARNNLTNEKGLKDITISPYCLWWLEFIPANGVVTLHDQKIFGALTCMRGRKYLRVPKGDKERAQSFIQSLKRKKLDKRYTVRLFTDKQFGMVKDWKAPIPYTQKQLDESVVI